MCQLLCAELHWRCNSIGPQELRPLVWARVRARPLLLASWLTTRGLARQIKNRGLEQRAKNERLSTWILLAGLSSLSSLTAGWGRFSGAGRAGRPTGLDGTEARVVACCNVQLKLLPRISQLNGCNDICCRQRAMTNWPAIVGAHFSYPPSAPSTGAGDSSFRDDHDSGYGEFCLSGLGNERRGRFI